MNSELILYQNLRTKLKRLCEENDLVADFEAETYPIMMTVRRNAELSGQLTIGGEEQEADRELLIVFTMRDGDLYYTVSKDLNISDDLFSKLKRLFRKLHSAYLQYLFRELVETGRLPKIQIPWMDQK